MLVVTNLSICLLFAWVVRTPVRFATLHCICYANISLWFFNLLISVKVLGAFWCDLFSCKFKSCIHCCNFTLWSWICILCDTQLMSYVGLWNRDIEQNTAKPTVVLYSSFKICADKDFFKLLKKKKHLLLSHHCKTHFCRCFHSFQTGTFCAFKHYLTQESECEQVIPFSTSLCWIFWSNKTIIKPDHKS